MSKPSKSGVARIIDAAGYSWSGLKAALKHEAAFRQELCLFVVLTPIALWLGEGGVEQALMIGSLLLVLIIELVNSASKRSWIALVVSCMSFPVAPKILALPQ